MSERLPPRSLLFVPGSRPDRFDKALAAGADMVCLDLEDAVAPEDKPGARSAVCDYLLSERSGSAEVGLRINASNTRFGIADLHHLMERNVAPDFVMLPKVESWQSVAQLIALLPDATQVVPIVESALGVAARAETFALSQVRTAVFGGVDYVADVGTTLAWESLLLPRGQLAQTGAAHGVTVLDVPYTSVKDLDGLMQETQRARGLGLQARCAIHPTQVPVIHAALQPDANAVEQAERVVAAFAAAQGSAALLDGQLIELPVFKAAENLLAQAQRE